MEKLELTGQRFDRLLVLREATPEEKPKDKNGKSKTRSFWICLCDCGKEVIISGRNLNSGNTKSCGCKQKEAVRKINFQDISNKRFGKLVALNVSDKKGKRGELYWHCQCDCGNTKEIMSTHLLQGKTLSCGCINSTNNMKIEKLLKELNISYEKEKSFQDLKGDKNMVLRFDFLIKYKNKIVLFEYQGEQHFYPIDYFGGEQSFKTQVHYDNLKRNYCKINNFPLIEWNYNEIINKENLIKKLEGAI